MVGTSTRLTLGWAHVAQRCSKFTALFCSGSISIVLKLKAQDKIHRNSTAMAGHLETSKFRKPGTWWLWRHKKKTKKKKQQDCCAATSSGLHKVPPFWGEGAWLWPPTDTKWSPQRPQIQNPCCAAPHEPMITGPYLQWNWTVSQHIDTICSQMWPLKKRRTHLQRCSRWHLLHISSRPTFPTLSRVAIHNSANFPSFVAIMYRSNRLWDDMSIPAYIHPCNKTHQQKIASPSEFFSWSHDLQKDHSAKQQHSISSVAGPSSHVELNALRLGKGYSSQRVIDGRPI